MKKSSMIYLLVMITFFIAGCGAATAPPVELPAPVVGRITVGSPDATGKSTITGAEGAVPGGSIVMAINLGASTLSALWQLTDLIIPSAYAQSLPSVCSETGHACTIASPTGSFILMIDASVGDAIALVLINLAGQEISERAVVIVPAISSAVEAGECAGLGLSGRIVDVAIPNGSKMALHEGDELFTNRIVTDAGAFALPGCQVTDMDVVLGTNEGDKVVVISEDESTVWVGAWNGSTFISALTFVLEDPPLNVASYGDPDHVALAVMIGGKFAIERLNLITGEVDKLVGAPDPASAHVYTDIVAMRSFGPFTDFGSVIMLVLVGEDSSGINYFVNFFETTNFGVSSLDFTPVNLSATISSFPAFGPPVITDASISSGLTILNTDVAMLFVDSANKTVWFGNLVGNFGGTIETIYVETKAANTFTHNLFISLSAVPFEPLTGITPKRIAVGLSEGAAKDAQTAYILADDALDTYNFWTIVGFADPSIFAEPMKLLPDAADPLFIATDNATKSIVVGDGTTNAAVIVDEWYEDF